MPLAIPSRPRPSTATTRRPPASPTAASSASAHAAWKCASSGLPTRSNLKTSMSGGTPVTRTLETTRVNTTRAHTTKPCARAELHLCSLDSSRYLIGSAIRRPRHAHVSLAHGTRSH